MIDKQRTAFEALPVHAPHSNRNREKSMTTKTDTEQEREALLPCPFCNSTDISLHSGLHIAHVECGGCGAQGPTVIIQAGQPARSAWNRQAALDSPEVQALRWQPIDTAPKDGSHVLLRSRSGRMADGFWGVRYEVWSWPYVMTEPAYWMPLPPPPADAAVINMEREL